MKKLIAVSAVAALAATALSAEITFGSWGRALWVTAANSGYYEGTDWKSETVSDVHQSWGGDSAPRTALAVSGNSDNVGFALDIHSNGTSLGQGDNALIWVKPIDIVKVSVGKHDQNVLRGDACFGLWNWDRVGVVKTAYSEQEGWTFNDYLDVKGVSITATPVEGLTLGVGIPLILDQKANWNAPTYENPDGISKDGPRTLSGIYAHGAAYVGAYAIEGIGTIKAAVKTEPKTTDDKSQTKLGFAFDLTAVENLFVTVGAKINTLEKTAKEVNAYARYGVNEQLTVHAIVGTSIGGNYTNKDGETKEGGFGFLAGAGVDYNLDGGIALFADVRYANNVYYSASQADNMDCLTLGAGVTKGFSNGLIGIAFEGATNSHSRYPQKDGKQFGWEIPVRFEYWF